MTMNYHELCKHLNRGLQTEDVEVLIKGQWITWSEAVKVLKGLDFDNVKYRRKNGQGNT